MSGFSIYNNLTNNLRHYASILDQDDQPIQHLEVTYGLILMNKQADWLQQPSTAYEFLPSQDQNKFAVYPKGSSQVVIDDAMNALAENC